MPVCFPLVVDFAVMEAGVNKAHAALPVPITRYINNVRTLRCEDLVYNKGGKEKVANIVGAKIVP